MKVFISHSWQNKNTAQLIAESLENNADVWLDIRHLKPGDATQPSIDEALAQMDVVALLWSKDAATSEGVDAEIRTAARLKKKILPVLLDETPTRTHAILRGLYGINLDVADPKIGLFRVQAGLVRMMLPDFDLDAASALNDLTSFEGFLQYVQEYRNRKEIGGEDGVLWAMRSMEQCNRSYKSLSDLRDQVGITLKFLQDTLARVQVAGNDRVAIQGILNETIRHPKSQTKEFKVLISFIEGALANLPAASTKPVTLRADAQQVAETFARKVEKAPRQARRRHDAAASRKPGAAEREAAAPDAADEQPNPALELVHNYIRSAPASLRQFTRLAAASPSMSLKWVANELNAYLTNPRDLIPDNENGILGFIDDAWLIHNTIYRCVEAGFFRPQDIGVRWDALVQADPFVIQIMPAPVRGALEQLLMQYLQVVANEMAQYQPQFTQQAQFNSYNAFMGGGAAVGGAPAGREKTIDDVFYTIGDKMVYYDGS